MKRSTRYLWPLVALCVMNGAGAQQAPQCRIEPTSADARSGDAGCLIAVDGRTLLIAHSGGGRLGFPGGTSRDDEPAQCTAHRETWEETGIDVEVGRFIKRLSTGFLLYACRTVEPVLRPSEVPELPAWSRSEVVRLLWRDLDRIAAEEWRFPDQIEEIRTLDDP